MSADSANVGLKSGITPAIEEFRQLIILWMKNGIRPLGDKDQGLSWKSDELAESCNVDVRLIAYWRSGERVTADPNTLEVAFLGTPASSIHDDDYKKRREEFRNKWESARCDKISRKTEFDDEITSDNDLGAPPKSLLDQKSANPINRLIVGQPIQSISEGKDQVVQTQLIALQSEEQLREALHTLIAIADKLKALNWGEQICYALIRSVEYVNVAVWNPSSEYLSRIGVLCTTIEELIPAFETYIDNTSYMFDLEDILKIFRDNSEKKYLDQDRFENFVLNEKGEYLVTRGIREKIDDIIAKLGRKPSGLINILDQICILLSLPGINTFRYQELQSELENYGLTDDFQATIEDVRHELCALISRHLDVAADLTVFRERLHGEIWGPEMVIIPDCHDGFLRRFENGYRQTITLSHRYALGRYPVTLNEYLNFSKHTHFINEDKYWGKWQVGRNVAELKKITYRDQLPIVDVSRHEALEYIGWLNKYSDSYRLPTEDEWEYACLGDKSGRCETPFSKRIAKLHQGSEIDQSEANLYFPSMPKEERHLTSVMAYRPNEFNLFQMHGNIWELCSNEYLSDNNASFLNGGVRSLRERTLYGIIKGGSYATQPIEAKVTSRRSLAIKYSKKHPNAYGDVGFRVAKTI